MSAIEEFESQPVLQPGQEGWWRVWGASVHHIRIGDVVLVKDIATIHIVGYFDAKADPVRVGLVDEFYNAFTLGALCPVIVVRRGTHNTLAE